MFPPPLSLSTLPLLSLSLLSSLQIYVVLVCVCGSYLLVYLELRYKHTRTDRPTEPESSAGARRRTARRPFFSHPRCPARKEVSKYTCSHTSIDRSHKHHDKHHPSWHPWIPITEPTMLRVAPGWRPPPYPRALACALASHAAHARARVRTCAHAALRRTTPHSVALCGTSGRLL